jgi:hypothetical protein
LVTSPEESAGTRRLGGAIADIAETIVGQTVLVLTQAGPGPGRSGGVGHRAPRPRRTGEAPGCAVAQAEGDADGYPLVGWPSGGSEQP